MIMKDLQVIGKKASNVVMRNSPTILSGLAVGGVVGTVSMGIAVTPTALEMIREEEDQRYKDILTKGIRPVKDPMIVVKLSKLEIIKLTWKLYAPTVLMGLATIGCIVGSNTIHLRRNAAVGALYELATNGLREYQAKVVETLGEKKEEKMREEIIQDRLDKHPVKETTIINNCRGTTLCCDSLTERYFFSDMETIRKVQNDFNKRVISDLWRPLNELYDDLGLEPTILGRDIGWDTDKLLDIRFTTKVAKGDREGQPCLVLEYEAEPRNVAYSR